VLADQLTLGNVKQQVASFGRVAVNGIILAELQ